MLCRNTNSLRYINFRPLNTMSPSLHPFLQEDRIKPKENVASTRKTEEAPGGGALRYHPLP